MYVACVPGAVCLAKEYLDLHPSGKIGKEDHERTLTAAFDKWKNNEAFSRRTRSKALNDATASKIPDQAWRNLNRTVSHIAGVSLPSSQKKDGRRGSFRMILGVVFRPFLSGF